MSIDKELIDYFIKQTNERFVGIEMKIDTKLSEIYKKLDELHKFKWQLIGIGAASGMIMSLLVTIAAAFIAKI